MKKKSFCRSYANKGNDLALIGWCAAVIIFVLRSVYIAFVFPQFTIFEILTISTLFFTIFLIISFVIFKSFCVRLIQLPIFLKYGVRNKFPVLVISSITIFALLINFSPSAQFFEYYPFFPLLNVDRGLNWHPDSAFHVSIINSILLYGIPSIGQHGTPLINYHVLSHFIDAALITIANIDAWESYGIFHQFKMTLFISIIISFVAAASNKTSVLFLLLSVAAFLPLMVGTWHAVGSHGLWFTSVLVIGLAKYVFDLVKLGKDATWSNYIVLFSIIGMVSFGKVSTGFALALLIGFTMFFSSFRSYKVYIFGSALVFFFIYLNIFFGGSSVPVDRSYFENMWDLMNNVKFLKASLFVVILATFLFVFGRFLKDKFFILFSLGGLAAFSVFSVLVFVRPAFMVINGWYFVFGLVSSYGLFVFLLISSLYKNVNYFEESLNNRRELVFQLTGGFVKIRFHMPFFLMAVFSILTLVSPLPQFNIFNWDFHYVAHNVIAGPFSEIETLEEFKAPQHRIYNSNRFTVEFDSIEPRPLSELRDMINSLISQSSLKKESLLLFVPEEIFVDELDFVVGKEWAAGMVVYAVTGVPLIHGLNSLGYFYGLRQYDGHAVWRSRDQFDFQMACSFGKDIIIVESMNPVDLSLHRCQLPGPN